MAVAGKIEVKIFYPETCPEEFTLRTERGEVPKGRDSSLTY
jgi:hypothetical protein